MRKINFYKTESDEYPVEKFLDSLNNNQVKKITWVMRIVEELPRVPKQYFKKLINTDGIWEIRAQLGSNIFRILGFFKEPTVFIATNGFQKKTENTPSSEIHLAQNRKIEYLKYSKRNGKHE